jgi:hypothetical protein
MRGPGLCSNRRHTCYEQDEFKLHDSCLRITLFISSLRLRNEVTILNDKAHARDEQVPQVPRI